MRRLHRNHLSLWLCIVSMWLSVCMPLASQLVQAHGAAPSDAMTMADGEDCTGVGMEHMPVSEHGKSTSMHMEACGYCSMAAHMPLVGAALLQAVLLAQVQPHAIVLLYRYLAPRPMRGRTNPLDPPRSDS